MPAWNASSAMRSGLPSADAAAGVSSPLGGGFGASVAIAILAGGALCSAAEPPDHGFRITSQAMPTTATTPPAT